MFGLVAMAEPPFASPSESQTDSCSTDGPVTDAAISAAVGVLQGLSFEQFRDSRCRELRKAMRPFIEEIVGKEKSPAELFKGEVAKAVRRENHGRKCRQEQQDKNHVNSVKLRAERYARLEELKQQAAIAERGGDVPMIADGAVDTVLNAAAIGDAPVSVAELETKMRHCYICKARFLELHTFYDRLCPACADLNWRKRHQTSDLRGRVAIVTGGRVKIGFHIALKLLRAGAAVIVTTRFPCDAAKRFQAEAQKEAAQAAVDPEHELSSITAVSAPHGETTLPAWLRRLRVVAIDLRDSPAIESFAKSLLDATDLRLDIIVHNACQTVRKPPAYYRDLVNRELAMGRQLAAPHASTAEDSVGDFQLALPSDARRIVSDGLELVGRSAESQRCIGFRDDAERTSALMAALPVPARALVPLVPGDEFEDAAQEDAYFPAGAVDHADQQLDLRETNTWLLPIDEVSTPEAAEVLAINALAPFILNSRLIPLMRRSPGGSVDKFIINVSAMEGKFYRNKTPNHPHTNMAKAALNMQTRTCSTALAQHDRIFMNAVDTGWINDENPLPRAARTAAHHDFQTPIDEIDAAARVLDPIFEGVNSSTPVHGLFLKDYHETEW